MIGFNKFRDMLSYIPGLLTLSLGIYLAIEQPQVTYVINQIHSIVELTEGKVGYSVWKNLDVFFHVRIFHVINPEQVMQGKFPEFEERGPYVYNINLNKRVISVDDEADEIAFSTFKTYRFNKTLSGSLSDDDEIVMLNIAYYGTILTIADKFPMFLDKLGNSVHKLFPNSYDIFLRAKVKDILFDGLPLVCDKETNKDLTLICSGLRGQKPPIIKNTDELDHYKYSFFDRMNVTDGGPFTVNRGVKDKNALGNITSYKGSRVSKYWSEEVCNLISGTDSITWPPMNKKLPFVMVFDPDACRTFRLNYKKEEIFHGLTGYRYELDETIWLEKNMNCYCPMNSKKVQQCLPTGLLDITKCQGAPVVCSEPHFLHADSNLLEFAQNLKPDARIHATSVTIEPTSGIPLSGSKRIQLNIKLKPIPSIALLSNVSEGYFPLVWVEETNTATFKQLESIIMAHRLLHVFEYFPSLIIVLGVFFTMRIWLLRDGNNNQLIVRPMSIQTQPTSQNHPVQRLIYHRPDGHHEPAFM